MNKLTLLFFAFFLTTFYVGAQTLKGNMMAGGNLSFQNQTYQGSNGSDKSINFYPSFGYFIVDNLAVGAILSLGSTTNDTGFSKTISTSMGFGPFARYYKFTSNENFAFFGHAQFVVSSGKVDNTPGGDTKSSGVSFSIAPGFSYFFTKHWALDLSITGLVIQSYDPNKSNANDKTTTVNFGISSFSPNLGFRYHFGN